MDVSTVACPACRFPLPPAFHNAGGVCPACGQALRVLAFPALYRPPDNAVPAAVSVPGDATCYAHADRVALAACDGCGRFMCGLCDLDFGGRHWCSACLQAAREQPGVRRFEARRIRFDGLSLALAFWPGAVLFTWFMTLFTAPAALFLAIRYWRRPLSILPRSRVRFVLAIALSVAQIVGWIALFYAVYRSITQTRGAL